MVQKPVIKIFNKALLLYNIFCNVTNFIFSNSEKTKNLLCYEDINQTGGFNIIIFLSYFTVNCLFLFMFWKLAAVFTRQITARWQHCSRFYTGVKKKN